MESGGAHLDRRRAAALRHTHPGRGGSGCVGARLRWGLLVAFLAWVLLMGLDPPDRSNWVFGNIPVLAVLPLVLWSFRLPLSDASYVAVFLFLGLHEYGTHHGYHVPWLDGDRNHYDRIIHASFGGLLVLPVRDALVRGGKGSGAWADLLAVTFMLAAAALYEIIEWLGALLFYDGPPELFLGHQGDALDATKDMALGLLGGGAGGGGVAPGRLACSGKRPSRRRGPVTRRVQSFNWGRSTVRCVSPVCCRSIDSKRARKLPSPKPCSPWRWMTS